MRLRKKSQQLCYRIRETACWELGLCGLLACPRGQGKPSGVKCGKRASGAVVIDSSKNRFVALHVGNRDSLSTIRGVAQEERAPLAQK
jgi:hypothetical protein